MIGSGPNCDVVLNAPDIKRIHCRIVWRGDRWRIEVAEGAGGVMLKNQPVKAGTLKAGDTVSLLLRFDKAGQVLVDVPVIAITAPAPGGATS